MDEERTWDLSILVEDTSIEGLTREADSSFYEIKEVVRKLKDESVEISPNRLLNGIRECERVFERLYRVAVYCYCRHVSDTMAEGSQILASIYYRLSNEADVQCKLLQHLLGGFVRTKPILLETPELIDYKHLLFKSDQIRSYVLPEDEEELVAEKDNNGISALAQLQSSWVGAQVLDIEIEGQKKAISMNHAFSLLMTEDRETRNNASEAYFGSFARDRLLHCTALRAICADHVNMTRRRKWPSFMTQSFIDQDVDEETITALLKTLQTESSSVQNYIRLKSKHFGHDRLLGYDLRAPWFPKAVWKEDWKGVKKSIIKAYDDFDNEIGNFVRTLFRNRYVDSLDRPGRANVGFCYSDYAKKTSFVFVTYNGLLNDAYIIAHEMGHAVQFHLMDKQQSILNSVLLSNCVAETGSIFGELVFTEHLLKECKSDELKIEILAKVLDRFYQTTFHISLWALFEKNLYEEISSGSFIDADKACDIWRNVRESVYGDTIDWSKTLDYEWARMGQLFYPNFRFYNYSYSFAQLLVFALYDDYKQHPSDFADRFKRLLSRGSSMSPREQIAEMGYDITRPDFWTLGIRRAEDFIDELQKLL